MWLSGGVGAGKSAIAQTFAEWCAYRRLLAGSFFFRRGDQRRASTQCICATLALQLVATLPHTRTHIEQELVADPLILDKDLHTQFDKLVVKPLQAVTGTGASFPSIVVVDALDECDDPVALKEFLLALGASVDSNSNRTTFRYFITSRPEYGIQSLFNSMVSYPQMSLDGNGEAEDDIRLYLKTSFSEIRDKYKDVMDSIAPWPSHDVVEQIVRKSSGHFIYASTVLNFIDDEGEHPADQLAVVLGNMSPSAGQSPFQALDELYHGILERAAQRNCDLVKDILGSLVVNRFQVTLPDLADNLGYSEAAIKIALRPLQSLVKRNDNLREDIHFLHASFPDFLLDNSRSGRFAVKNAEYCEKMARIHLTYVTLGLSTNLQSNTVTRSKHRTSVSLRNASSYLARCVLPLSQERHIAFQTVALSKLDITPHHIRQPNPDRLGPIILHKLLKSAFAEIYNRHQNDIEPPWPRVDIIEYLVEKFGLITVDQFPTLLVVLNFINRGHPPLRLNRLLQVFCRNQILWNLESLFAWIFYLVCDSDHRASSYLRTLAIVDAALKSGINPSGAMIQSCLDVAHIHLQDITQDLHPLVVSRGTGNDLVLEADGGFIRSCLQHDWTGEYNIGKREVWLTELTLECMRKQGHQIAEGE